MIDEWDYDHDTQFHNTPAFSGVPLPNLSPRAPQQHYSNNQHRRTFPSTPHQQQHNQHHQQRHHHHYPNRDGMTNQRYDDFRGSNGNQGSFSHQQSYHQGGSGAGHYGPPHFQNQRRDTYQNNNNNNNYVERRRSGSHSNHSSRNDLGGSGSHSGINAEDAWKMTTDDEYRRRSDGMSSSNRGQHSHTPLMPGNNYDNNNDHGRPSMDDMLYEPVRRPTPHRSLSPTSPRFEGNGPRGNSSDGGPIRDKQKRDDGWHLSPNMNRQSQQQDLRRSTLTDGSAASPHNMNMGGPYDGRRGHHHSYNNTNSHHIRRQPYHHQRQGYRQRPPRPKSSNQEEFSFSYDEDQNQAPIQQHLEWISKKGVYLIRDDDLSLRESEKSVDYNVFGQKDALERMFELKKSLFDTNVHEEDINSALARSNPYDLIHESIFYFAEAIEIANLDVHLQLTDSLKSKSLNEGIRFVDLGSNGVVEYLFWRMNSMKIPVKGFGFGNRQVNDYYMDDLMESIRGRMTINYGLDGTGNILDEDNIRSFVDLVITRTEKQRVDIMFACRDTPAADDLLEHEHQQLMMVQILISLQVLKEGGDFAIRIYDCFEWFTVELLYLLYSAFDRIAIVKPFTGHTTDTFRYVVCRRFKGTTHAVLDHLYKVNSKMSKRKEQTAVPTKKARHVDHLIDPSLIQHDHEFKKWITGANMNITKEVTEACQEFFECLKDKRRKNYSHLRVRNEVYRYFDLPLPDL